LCDLTVYIFVKVYVVRIAMSAVVSLQPLIHYETWSTENQTQTRSTAPKKQHPCPCVRCKPSGATQIQSTRRRHLLKYGKAASAVLNPVSSLSTAVLELSGTFNSEDSSFSPQGSATPDLVDSGILPIEFGDSDYYAISPTSSHSKSSFGSDSESDEDHAESATSSEVNSITDGDFRVAARHDLTDHPGLPDSDDDSDEIPLLEDPLFRSRAAMFEPKDADEDYEGGDDAGLPPAFSEHPALRNAYIHVFVDAAYRGATHESVKSSLTSTHSTIRTMLAETPAPEDLDLAHMARTLRTVENRLGVNPDKLLTYYFLCPECWQVYHPSCLYQLKTASCTFPDCSGILYTSKRTTLRSEKRTPTKVMPSASLIKALQLFFMRPGKWEEVHAWMKDHDRGPAPTISREQWLDSLDPHLPLEDITDGWFWRFIPAGFERFWDSDRKKLVDVDVKRLNQRHVSLECGLVLQINLDWSVHF
jgi:hypothetical protein